MKRLAELRREKGLNQVGLGLKLHVSQKMISAYENDTHQPNIETLKEMSKLFGVSADYLIGLSDIRLPADRLICDGLKENEIELLDLFNQLKKEDQTKALGILFALLQQSQNI
ncbi:MAG: helix-turn-helix transcriptional regulator [Clostridia bacterium]|nr:helix-turn-helix transcriptional regulator [Clostridia bacterium]